MNPFRSRPPLSGHHFTPSFSLKCALSRLYRCAMTTRWSAWWPSPSSCRRSLGSLIWILPGKYSQHTASPKRPHPNWRPARPQRRSNIVSCLLVTQSNWTWIIYVNINTNKTNLHIKDLDSLFLDFELNQSFILDLIFWSAPTLRLLY